MSCNVRGCEGQSVFTGERTEELRRFSWSRDHLSGADIVCRRCHGVIMRARRENRGLVLTWDEGTVYPES